MVDQFPRAFGFCVSGTPLVVATDTILEVFGGTDVVGAVFEALEYVDMERHKKKPIRFLIGFQLSGGDDETRTRDLPALQAGRSNQS